MRAVVQFLRQSAEPCAAPPTSPFTALLMEPQAVGAQARLPRCSSDCGCTLLAVLRSGPEFCRPKTLDLQNNRTYTPFSEESKKMECFADRTSHVSHTQITFRVWLEIASFASFLKIVTIPGEFHVARSTLMA